MKTLITVAVLVAVLLGGCGEEGGWVVGFLPELDQTKGMITLTPVKVGLTKNLDGVSDYYENPADIKEKEIQASLAQAQELWKTVNTVFIPNERLASVLKDSVFVLMDDASSVYPGYTYYDKEHDTICYEVKSTDGAALAKCPSEACPYHKLVAIKKPGLLQPERLESTITHEVLHILNYDLRESDPGVMTTLVETLETLWSGTGSQNSSADQLLGGGYSGFVMAGDHKAEANFDRYAMAKIAKDYPDDDMLGQAEKGMALYALWNSVGKLAWLFTGSYASFLSKGHPDLSYSQLRRLFLEKEALSVLGEQASEGSGLPAVLKPPYALVCAEAYLTALFGQCPQQLFCGSDNHYLLAENFSEYLNLIRQIVPSVLGEIAADIESGKL